MTILLQNSLAGAIMIFAVAVLRGLALHSLPKNTFCALWIAAALRLMLPFSLESKCSVFTLLGSLLKKDGGELRLTASAISAVETSSGIQAVIQRPFPALQVLWLIGFCALAGFFLISYLRTMKRFRRAVPVEDIELPLRRVQVRQTGGITGPLTYGFFRPVILLPEGWEDRDDLTLVLAHECAHIRRGDCLTKLLFVAALCVHWFNPAVWLLCWLGNRDMELACDAAAIRSLGESRRFDYARTLLGQAEQNHSFLFNHFGTSAVEERVAAALKYRKMPVWRISAACLLAAGMLTVFGTSAAAGECEPMEPGISADILPGEEWFSIGFRSDDPTETFDALKLTTLDGEPIVLTQDLWVDFLLNDRAVEEGVVYGILGKSGSGYVMQNGQKIILQTDLRVVSEEPLTFALGEMQHQYAGHNCCMLFSRMKGER